MKAVIAAAGLSTRMYDLEEARNIPKCLLPLGNKSIINRTIDCLMALDIDDIYVITGYKYEMIEDAMWRTLNYIHNPFYTVSNNMASLWMAKPYLDNYEFIYLHSDLVFDNDILRSVVQNPGHVLAVEFRTLYDEEDMMVSAREFLTEDNKELYLKESYKGMSQEKVAGEWIGLAKFDGHDVFKYIEKRLMAGNLEDYDTAAFTDMAKEHDILLQSTEGHKWVEIDYPEEYEWATNQNWKM